MLASTLFALLTAGHLGLVCRCGLRFARTGDRILLVPALVAAALVYDNGVLAAGRWIGVGEALELWTVPRFVAHIVLTPLLIPWSCAAAGRAGVGWARRPGVRAAAYAVTGAVIALGVFGELLHLELMPAEWARTVRYTARESSLAGVLPVIVTVLVVLVAALAVWRARGFRLWTVTTVTMLVVAGAMPPMLLTNCAELLFMAGIVATAIWLSGADRASGAGRDGGSPGPGQAMNTRPRGRL
ncbi:hypothetical protein [Nocardia sp. NPDC024068]|uniref:hypothetical protein n=1 Tax=Nocardia sp. NPDC024068 TaxID=3157197 RepID=UPI00340751AD